MITFIESLTEEQKDLLWNHIDALIKKAYDEGVVAGLDRACSIINRENNRDTTGV